MTSAFVIIDMQKQFMDHHERLTPRRQDAIELINYVAERFRASGRPVIWIKDEEDEGPGDPGFELIEGLEARPDLDRFVHKVYGNIFRETRLEAELKAYGVDFLLIAGWRAENCVLSTLKGAEDRDIPYALLRGAVVSNVPESVAFVENNAPIISYELTGLLLR